jgi:hypothetical protein
MLRVISAAKLFELRGTGGVLLTALNQFQAYMILRKTSGKTKVAAMS